MGNIYFEQTSLTRSSLESSWPYQMGTQMAPTLLETRRWIWPLQGATAAWGPSELENTGSLLDGQIVKLYDLFENFSAEAVV